MTNSLPPLIELIHRATSMPPCSAVHRVGMSDTARCHRYPSLCRESRRFTNVFEQVQRGRAGRQCGKPPSQKLISPLRSNRASARSAWPGRCTDRSLSDRRSCLAQRGTSVGSQLGWCSPMLNQRPGATIFQRMSHLTSAHPSEEFVVGPSRVSLCTIFDGERIANRDGEGCWSFRMRD